MKHPVILRLFALACCLTAAPLQASTPASIAGLVYHERDPNFGLDVIIWFKPDGHYTYLKNAVNRKLMPLSTGGTYVYNPSLGGASGTASVILTDPNTQLYNRIAGVFARSLDMIFDFEGALNGTVRIVPQGGGPFYFTDSRVGRPSPVVNVSLRGNVAPGRPLIAGFVVPPAANGERISTPLLVRVVGPTLAQFKVDGAWADPDFSLQGVNPAESEETHHGDWSETRDSRLTFQGIFTHVGAFSLPDGSRDAASLVRLAPGAYTVLCAASAGDAGGEALIEVYTLP